MDEHLPPRDSDALRLPSGAVPSRYDLTVAPDLAAATFRGEVAIDLELHEATDRIVCNAAELTISEAWIELDGQRLGADIALDEAAEQVTFTFEETLRPGEAVLRASFAGILNDKLHGFYRSTYTDDDGSRHTIAVTQFEATDARRAFPCWDEPAHKAVFAIRLEVADDLLAVSNGPELARESLDGGRVRITFADTMPMSTYLVAFVVGPLEATEPVDVDGVPLRIVHQPGQGELAEFAQEVGAFALRYFADYYGIVYPGDKMDMVAVPDFAFGAMENLGCVIYRETLLMVDPRTATQSELLAVVDVIAHELAHMWFGDLVTMSWWNGIWLNEAFATFMEMKCAAAFRPEWERWMHFGRERSTAFDTDSLHATRAIEFPVHSPEDAEGMFDVLTYQKGSAVVRMLEQFLGERAFRDGIRRYLQTHQFGNTETTDLWESLEAETGEPVRAMMDTWIFQGGFPVLTVRPLDGGSIRLEQQWFTFLGDDRDPDDRRWHVPVILRGGEERTSLVLDGAASTVDVAGRPLMVNAGGHGFYRAQYATPLFDDLVADLPSLDPLERYAVLDDSLALCVAGLLAPAGLTGMLRRLSDVGEDDLSIWQLGVDALRTLGRAVPPSGRETWSAWVRSILRPVWDQLGPAVRSEDSDRQRALRGLLLGALGVERDPEVWPLAERLFDEAISDASTVEPGLASGALQTMAALADGRRFDAVLDVFRSGRTSQEQIRHLYAAATVEDEALFQRYLDLLATDEVRSQNLAFAYRAAIRNRLHGHLAWAQVRDNWDRIVDRLPSNAIGRLIEGITVQTETEVADDILVFLADHPVPQAAKVIAQHVERMQVSVEFRRSAGDAILASVS